MTIAPKRVSVSNQWLHHRKCPKLLRHPITPLPRWKGECRTSRNTNSLEASAPKWKIGRCEKQNNCGAGWGRGKLQVYFKCAHIYFEFILQPRDERNMIYLIEYLNGPFTLFIALDPFRTAHIRVAISRFVGPLAILYFVLSFAYPTFYIRIESDWIYEGIWIFIFLHFTL